LFGLVGAVYYIDVLIIKWFPWLPVHDLSAVRVTIQYTMVATWLFLWLLRDWKNGHH